MNYMDYVDDDSMFMLTLGQADRIEATLAGPRASLASSKGLQAPNPTPVVTLIADGYDLAARQAPIPALDDHGTPATTLFDGRDWFPL